MRLFLSILIAGLVIGSSSRTVPLAQGTPSTGVIAGVVLDLAGDAVPDHVVQLRDTADSVVRTTTTNANGAFRFEAVPSGIYTVVAYTQSTYATTRVAVSAGATAPLRLVLGPISTAEDAGPMRSVVQNFAPPPPPPPGPYRSSVVSGISAVAGYASPGLPTVNREAYARIDEIGFRRVTDAPLSTFAVDVDTASYANVRRFLDEGRLPPADAVRLEEMINYFRFDYAEPAGGVPFSVTTEIGPAPWASAHRLVLIGLKGRALPATEVPRRNLVFLLDVSGSMHAPDKLPLVKHAMRMLVLTLTSGDRVSIVTYAGGTQVVLEPTSGAETARIEAAIDALRAGGSTAGASGIELAYERAKQSFIRDGVNRVILATDGDFNVGMSSTGELIRLIEDRREEGVFLSVLGVGTGNLNDEMMEQLADRGNGNYSYLDSLLEARRVLIAEANATFVTIAKDVKVQVEFNPLRVGAYRLIGYENRVLADEDFTDDTKDAGEIGAGHTVTALYEVVPAGVDLDIPGLEPLKYLSPSQPTTAAASDELLTVKLRYKDPDSETSQPLDTRLVDRTGELTPNLGFAAAVAEFAMLLRDSEYKGQATWRDAAALARQHRGADLEGYRAELVRLIELAEALKR